VPAPNQEVRDRLAGRRELRADKLPPGLFPSTDDWAVTVIEAPAGGPEAVKPAVISRRATGIAVGLVFVGVVGAAIVVQSARASNRHRTPLRANPRGGEVG